MADQHGSDEARQLWALQMAAFAYVQGGGPKEAPPPRVDTRTCYKCGYAGHLAATCPRGGPFVPAPERVPEPEKPKWTSDGPCLEFGVRGDSLMQTKYEGASKYVKKYRNYKADMENEFWSAFGDVNIDYEVQGMYVKDVVDSIINQPTPWDILCVGITCNELFVTLGEYGGKHAIKPEVQETYPEEFDQTLQLLAAAILSKSKGSLVLCGGPSELWGYPARWDKFVERAANVLRTAGVQVVPRETANAVMQMFSLADDSIHFKNDDGEKEMFAKAWAGWLMAAAADPTFGRTISDLDEDSKRQAEVRIMETQMQQAIMEAQKAAPVPQYWAPTPKPAEIIAKPAPQREETVQQRNARILLGQAGRATGQGRPRSRSPQRALPQPSSSSAGGAPVDDSQLGLADLMKLGFG